MNETRGWLESSHLRKSGDGAHALQRFDTLNAALRRRILEHGDQAAAVSVALAHEYFKGAVGLAAKRVDALDDWEARAFRLLAIEGGGREAMLAYLGLNAELLCACEAHLAARWFELSEEFGRLNRRIGCHFLQTTGTMLCDRAIPQDGSGPSAASPCFDRNSLEAWQRAATGMLESSQWRGEFVAGGIIDSMPRLAGLLAPKDVPVWASALLAMAGASRTPALPHVPADLAELTPELAGCVVHQVENLSHSSPSSAARLLERLPRALVALPRAAAQKLADNLPDFVQSEDLADTLAQVPTVTHAANRNDVEFLFHQLSRVSQAFPAGATSFLRTMERAFERGGCEGVRLWVAKGVELGLANRSAGLSHLRLETRTSHKILRQHSPAVAFEEIEGLMQRFLIMMSRRSFQLIPSPGVWFRPPLAAPEETCLRLPERIDLCKTAEDNQLFYKLTLAHIAGRYEYGTYELSRTRLIEQGILEDDPEAESDDVIGVINSLANPLLAASLFILLEGIRIDACLAREFPGLAADFVRLGAAYAAHPPPAAADRPSESFLEALFMMSVGGCYAETLEPRLRRIGRTLTRAVEALRSPRADVYDSARFLLAYYGGLRLAQAHDAGELSAEDLPALALEIGGATVIDPFDHMDEAASAASVADANADAESDAAEFAADLSEQEMRLSLDGPDEQPSSAGVPMTPEEIKALIEAGVRLRITSARPSDEQASLGLYITDLLGKLPAAAIRELREKIEAGDASAVTAWLLDRSSDKVHTYDEWDYKIEDYRRQWCRLSESPVSGDTGEYFNRVLTRSGELTSSLKREFQRLKPEQYRKVRGMEHGEEFDLAALVDAHADRRSHKPPSDRLYVARRREERDIATLFLLDMSASTDEPLPEALQDETGERRVIEVLKDTLVVMSEVTEDIGDAYAVYGFSGHGRDNVEYYHVKAFGERLSAKVKARLGGLGPKRSTRMGTALRHSAAKIARVTARSKYLILLSDGFPQDFDYGEDRRSNVYGIQDTAKALQELESQGVRTFCITVDPAGNDYLRDMCPQSRYAVIKDISSLPEELAHIYQSLTRS